MKSKGFSGVYLERVTSPGVLKPIPQAVREATAKYIWRG
jgi:hypothetical protein